MIRPIWRRRKNQTPRIRHRRREAQSGLRRRRPHDWEYKAQVADHEADHRVENFTAMTRCVVYGLQHRAVQGMLDFDFICSREKPSVAGMIFPFSANHFVKFYWGTDEILMPVYQSMQEAFEKHPECR